MIQYIKIYILFLTSVLSINTYAFTFTEEEIKNAKSLDDLVSIFRTKTGNTKLSRENIINLATLDLNILYLKDLNAQTKKVMNAEDPIASFNAKNKESKKIVKAGNTEYHLHGIMYGNGNSINLLSTKGNMPVYLNSIKENYKKFQNDYNRKTPHARKVKDAAPPTLSEYGFNEIFNEMLFIETPDHIIEVQDGITPTSILNVYFDLITAITAMHCFTQSNNPEDCYTELGKLLEAIYLNPLEFPPPRTLPTHLMLELVLNEDLSKIKEDTQSFRRSLYMTGFLKSFAQRNNLLSVAYFTGASHAEDIKYLLKDKTGLVQQSKEYQLGFKHAKMSGEEYLEVMNDIDTFNNHKHLIHNTIHFASNSGKLLPAAFSKSQAYSYLASTRTSYKMYVLLILLTHLQKVVYTNTSFSSILNHLDAFGLWAFATDSLMNPLYSFPAVMAFYHSVRNSYNN